MLNILVLGASSPIGISLSEFFSSGNNIVLSGRNISNLNVAADICRQSGAHSITVLPADLAISIKPITDINLVMPFDLIIDAASTSSSLRDGQIEPLTLSRIIESDLLSHLNIYQLISKQNCHHPNIIFISSVLSRVQTTEREIYSMMKRLIEIYLNKISITNADVRILIFQIGSVINGAESNWETKKIAKIVRQNFDKGVSLNLYGTFGRVLVMLSFIHQLAPILPIKIYRRIRKLFSK
jgi:short-subunit dehydrogenase